MKQLYEVGEVVILESHSHPEFNGEYPVLGVYKLNKEDMTVVCEDIGKTLKFKTLSTDFVYNLGNFLDAAHYTLNDETELRKKHEPSQQSFKDLMTTLKSPQKVEWD